MGQPYFELGRLIVEHEKDRKEKAEYEKSLHLNSQLQAQLDAVGSTIVGDSDVGRITI